MHSVKAKRKVYPDTLDIDTAGGSISKIAPQDWELPEIKIQSAVSTHFDNVNQKPSGMAARLYTHSHTSITRPGTSSHSTSNQRVDFDKSHRSSNFRELRPTRTFTFDPVRQEKELTSPIRSNAELQQIESSIIQELPMDNDQPGLEQINTHALQSPAKSTDPKFNGFTDPVVPLLSAVTSTGYPNTLHHILRPLKKRISKGKYPMFDDPQKLSPFFQGQPSEQLFEEIYKLSTTQEGKDFLASKINDLSVTQINFLLFHLAKIGDGSSLSILSRVHNLDFNFKDDEGRTAIFYAAIGNHKSSMKILIKHGSLTDLIDSSGRTPLLWACYYGCDSTSKFLINENATMVYHEDFQKRTCLHCSTYPENSKTLKLLLKVLRHKREVDFLDEECMTPLMWAAFYGNSANVKLLLKAGSNAYLKDIEGKTALHWAASSNRHSGCVKTLFKHDVHLADVKDNMGRYALHNAAGEGNCAIVDAFIKEKITKIGVRDNLGRTPLHWASVRGHVACIKLLCDRGANLDKVDQYGATALHYSAEKNFADCVHVLIKKGATVDVKDENGETPLHWSASEGAIDSVKMLVDTMRDSIDITDSQGLTPLHLAALSGSTACCVFLIQHGASLWNLDSKQHTPLFRAVVGGSSDCTLALINEGADVNSSDINGRFPLHWAASSGHLDVVHILVGYGANPNCVDSINTPPLQEAAFQGHSGIVSYLIQCGANVEARDDDGITAMHRAAFNGHIETCRVLIQAGARINVLDRNDRESPYDLCKKNNHFECSKYLAEEGALSSEAIFISSAKKIQKSWRMSKKPLKSPNSNNSTNVKLSQRPRNRSVSNANGKDLEDKWKQLEKERHSLNLERKQLELERQDFDQRLRQFLDEKKRFEHELNKYSLQDHRKISMEELSRPRERRKSASENGLLTEPNNHKKHRKKKSEAAELAASASNALEATFSEAKKVKSDEVTENRKRSKEDDLLASGKSKSSQAEKIEESKQLPTDNVKGSETVTNSNSLDGSIEGYMQELSKTFSNQSILKSNIPDSSLADSSGAASKRTRKGSNKTELVEALSSPNIVEGNRARKTSKTKEGIESRKMSATSLKSTTSKNELGGDPASLSRIHEGENHEDF